MEALESTIVFIHKNCSKSYCHELKNIKRILEKEIVDLTEDDIKSTGHVIDTLEAVLWAFFHAEGYRETVLKAINLGGDTDTIGAIAGGISGVYYGFYDIPDNWRECIAKKEELCQMFERFIAG